MATEAQMLANQRNAQKSTGPRTDAGKAKSRTNATMHGLTSELLPDELTMSDVYQDRHQQLNDEFQPTTPHLKNSMAMAVASLIQFTVATDMLSHEFAKRKNAAKKGWDIVKENEAMRLMAKISVSPLDTVAQLRSTKAGCELLIQQWTSLKNIAAKQGKWSESDIQAAFDLMGTPKRFRADTSQVVPENSDTTGEFQKNLAETQIQKLQRALDLCINEADEFEREGHLNGPVIPFSPETKLLMRYQTEAMRRYMKYMKPLVDTLPKAPGRKKAPEPPPPPCPLFSP